MVKALEIIVTILQLLLTGFVALYPRAIWNNILRWLTDKEEPSEFYFDMQRIICAVLFFIFLLGAFMRYS